MVKLNENPFIAKGWFQLGEKLRCVPSKGMLRKERDLIDDKVMEKV